MNNIVKVSVTITSDAVVNLRKVVSFASSSPLINLEVRNGLTLSSSGWTDFEQGNYFDIGWYDGGMQLI